MSTSQSALLTNELHMDNSSVETCLDSASNDVPDSACGTKSCVDGNICIAQFSDSNSDPAQFSSRDVRAKLETVLSVENENDQVQSMQCDYALAPPPPPPPTPSPGGSAPNEVFEGALAAVQWITWDQLAELITSNTGNNLLVIDSRSFLDYNTCHVQGAVNICCSKIVKRRLQQDKITIQELLNNSLSGVQLDPKMRVVVYDQNSCGVPCSSADAFLPVLLAKLTAAFHFVRLVHGGFVRFHAARRSLCTDKAQLPPSKKMNIGAVSQPCISSQGPTRILPFLYLGSQMDAMNHDLLNSYNITYELNVSTTCPKPDFIQDANFLRIPVNDNYSDKLLPHFPLAFRFLDKVRESSGCVLVHCLGGISRSATIAIAYIMRHMRMNSDDAYRYLKSKRATISPNFNFLGQLLDYEKQLYQERILGTGVSPSNANVRISQVNSPVNENAPLLTSNIGSPQHHLLHHHFNPHPLHSPTVDQANTSVEDTSLNSHLISTNSQTVQKSKGSNAVPSSDKVDSDYNVNTEKDACEEEDHCASTSGQKRHCSFSSVSAANSRKMTLKLPVNDQFDAVSTLAFI